MHTKIVLMIQISQWTVMKIMLKIDAWLIVVSKINTQLNSKWLKVVEISNKTKKRVRFGTRHWRWINNNFSKIYPQKIKYNHKMRQVRPSSFSKPLSNFNYKPVSWIVRKMRSRAIQSVEMMIQGRRLIRTLMIRRRLWMKCPKSSRRQIMTAALKTENKIRCRKLKQTRWVIRQLNNLRSQISIKCWFNNEILPKRVLYLAIPSSGTDLHLITIFSPK